MTENDPAAGTMSGSIQLRTDLLQRGGSTHYRTLGTERQVRIYAVTEQEMSQLSWMHPASAVLAGFGVNLLSSWVTSPDSLGRAAIVSGIVFVVAAGFIQFMAWRIAARIKRECRQSGNPVS